MSRTEEQVLGDMNKAFLDMLRVNKHIEDNKANRFIFEMGYLSGGGDSLKEVFDVKQG